MARSRRVVAMLAGLGALAVACNGIIGLNDYTKGECSGGRCGDGSFDDVAVDQAAPDAAPDAPRGADPVSWAQWPIPNYDAGSGMPLPNQPQYDTTISGVVVDKLTKLAWQAVALREGPFEEAAKACAAIAGGGWRLPKRIEIVTLIEYGRVPTIDPVFTGVLNDRVWTSSEMRPFDPANPSYWTVYFQTGVVEPQSSILSAKALCVKGS